MTLSPTEPFTPLEIPENTESESAQINTQDDTHTTTLRLPPRSARKSLNAQKKLTPGKGKKWRTRNEGIDGKWYVERALTNVPTSLINSYLLDLPPDALHLLLAKLPPRSLKALSVTCKTLQEDLSIEGIWRECYANRFMWDGAATEVAAKAEMKVLVQGCMGDGGRGWRREALNREAMIE